MAISRKLVDICPEFNSPESSKEICIGHTFSLIEESRVHDSLKGSYSSIRDWADSNESFYSTWNDFDKILNSYKPFPRLMSEQAHNIRRHSTVHIVSSIDTKNCSIWYYDPSGSSISRESKLWDETITKYNHFSRMPLAKDVKEIDFNYESIERNTPLRDYEISIYISYQIRNIFEILPTEPQNIINNELRKFRRETSDSSIHSILINLKNHMLCMFILKELWGAKHVTVHNPLLSTPIQGPQSQFNDGFCPLRKNNDEIKITDAIHCNSSMGACVVWTSIYRILADVYSTRFDNDIDLIKFLKDNPLVGEESALDLLGKVMFNSFKYAKLHKPFMSAMYDFIPTRNEIDLDKLLSKFSKITKKNNEFLDNNQKELFRIEKISISNITELFLKMPPGYQNDFKEFIGIFVSDKKTINQMLNAAKKIIDERQKDLRWKAISLGNIYKTILILINCKLKANLI